MIVRMGDVSKSVRWLRIPFMLAERGGDAALQRQPLACAAGLLSAWTALFVAVWFAALFGIVGALWGFFGLGFFTLGIGQGSQAFALTGGAAGFVAGALAGITVIYGHSISQAPLEVLISLVVGFFFACALTFLVVALEGVFLDFRHYRRPSHRAEEGKLDGLLEDVATQMGFRLVPSLRIHDSPVPGAWTHTRHIVLSKGLLAQMDDDEVAAVMAHELSHFASYDAWAKVFVWACSFPIVVLVNLYACISMRNEKPGRVTGLLGLLIWPAIVLVRFLVVPLMMSRSRKSEYEADAAAIAAGYGPALHSALEKLKDFEVARTGWEQALLRTHPPVEFRLEAIEDAAASPPKRRAAPAGSNGSGKTPARRSAAARSH